MSCALYANQIKSDIHGSGFSLTGFVSGYASDPVVNKSLKPQNERDFLGDVPSWYIFDTKQLIRGLQ
jgi:hypothetical protein